MDRHGHKKLQQQTDTVHQRHAQTIHLTAVHEYTTVACCYHVSRGETGDPWSGKKNNKIKTKAWAPLTWRHFSWPSPWKLHWPLLRSEHKGEVYIQAWGVNTRTNQHSEDNQKVFCKSWQSYTTKYPRHVLAKIRHGHSLGILSFPAWVSWVDVRLSHSLSNGGRQLTADRWDTPTITAPLHTPLGNGLALLESCRMVSSSVKSPHSFNLLLIF